MNDNQNKIDNSNYQSDVFVVDWACVATTKGEKIWFGK